VGRALTAAIVAAGALAAAPAHAQPRTAALRVTPACAAVVDAEAILVALRVELAPLGVGSVLPGDTADVALAVDCPGGDSVVVAYGDRRAEIALGDVDPPARPRVLALAVAEQLRPDRAPAPPAPAAGTRITVEPPARTRRWELGVRADLAFADAADVVVITASAGRRFDRLRLELGAGPIRGVGGSGATGWALEARASFQLAAAGRFGFGAGAGLLAATVEANGMTREWSTAVRGDLRVELRFAPAWSIVALAGGGRAVSTAETFTAVGAAVVAGL
jgi:hypothetical protein